MSVICKMGTVEGYPTEKIQLCHGYQTERKTTIAPLGSWRGHHHICLIFFPGGVPEGQVYGRRLAFVSVRTIKRHHHHPAMGTRPRPRQAAAAAAGWDEAWEARTGPRQTQTCRDTPATARLRRGSPLTTLQPTKRQPATAGAVERGGRVTTARQTTTRAVPG